MLFGVPCLVTAAGDDGRPVTFAKDIAPTFQEKCQNCHRAGQMAPMSLVTYEEVRPWAKAIKQRVVLRQMPPWHMDPTIGIQKFQNDISLNDAQIAVISKWVDEGAPMGNKDDMPAPRKWPNDEGWQLASQCQGRSKTRPLGRRENRPLPRQLRVCIEGFAGAAGV